MTQRILLQSALLLSSLSAHGAVTLYAEYHLGESGSLGASNSSIIDSSGNGRNLTNAISGGTTSVGTSGVSAPGSTAYLSTAGTGNEGWYSSTNIYSTLPTDNFAFGVYVRAASNTATTRGDVFTLGSSPSAGNEAFKVSLEATGWTASEHNVSYIGSAGTFTADLWVHLAVIRSGGVSTFYVDGVAQGGTYAGAPVHNNPHLSVNPGGLAYFDGQIDEVRVVTFTSGESTANVMNTLQAVPEPSAILLGVLGFLSVFRRRRD